MKRFLPFKTYENLLNSDRASILIVTLGILTALVILATTFTTLQRVESRGAKNYNDRVDAGHIASATLQYSIERLRTASLTYNGVTNLRLGAACNAYSVDPVNFYGFYNFTLTQPTSDPGITGACDAKILDCSSQIYIGRMAGAICTDRLQHVLTGLMVYLNAYQPPLTAFDTVNDAAGIYNVVVGTGYTAKSQIISNGLTGTTTQKKQKYEGIKDYLSVYGVPDPTTIQPDLMPQPRAPMNLNTVSGPVLVALLAPLLADDLPGSAPSPTAEEKLAGILISNRPFLGWVKPASPSPNANWNRQLSTGIVEGKGFVNLLQETAIETTMTPYYTLGAPAWRADRDKIIANFLPNSVLSYANPSYNISKGKDQVSSGTTEFALKSSGFFEILLTCHIYGPPTNTIYSERKYEAVVRTHELWKQTTQAEFISGATFTATEIKTYPEHSSVMAAGSTTDGMLGLAPNELTAGSPTFRVSYTTSFTANVFDAGPGGAATVQSGSNINDNIALSDPTQANYPGELTVEGAYLAKEGPNRLTDNGGDDSAEQIYYSLASTSSKGKGGSTGGGSSAGCSVDPTLGTLSFWVKLNFTPAIAAGSPVELFFYPYQFSDLGPPVVTVNGNLKLFIEGNGAVAQLRGEYIAADASTFAAVTLTTSQDLTNWKKGEWHYIAMLWDSNNGANSTLQTYVDGVAGAVTTGVLLNPGAILDQTLINNRGRFGGVVATGAAATQVGTFDEIRAWTALMPTQAGDPGLDRFFGTGSPQFESSVFPSATSKLDYPLYIATTSWTEHLPNDGGTANIQVEVGVDTNGNGIFTDGVDRLSLALTDGAGGLLAWSVDPSPFRVQPTTPPGGQGVALKYRVTFTSPAAPNIYPAPTSYPAAGMTRKVDTPFLDDIVTTILRAPKVYYLREIIE